MTERSRVDFYSLQIRWIPAAKAFFVDFGNVRFSVSKTAALLLADGLHEAVRCLPEGIQPGAAKEAGSPEAQP